jgi:pimeloyl-ACP methyl ester carboxylesterase
MKVIYYFRIYQAPGLLLAAQNAGCRFCFHRKQKRRTNILGIFLLLEETVNSMHKTMSMAGEYTFVNGIDLYYEAHGTGDPLILLHGGLASTEMFKDILPTLAKHRHVITVDLQAHGRTADINRPMTFEAMGDDIAALIQHFGLGRADLMGYSLGGNTALQAAIRHPDLVKRLVLVSIPFKRRGWYPENLAGMDGMGAEASDAMKQSPIYQNYASIAPRPDDWPVLLTKVGKLLRQEYDWSQDVKALKTPTLLVYADHDAVRLDHIVEFFKLLGGGQKDAGWDRSGMTNHRLAILPGVTHYDLITSPLLVSAVTPFLDMPMPKGR